MGFGGRDRIARAYCKLDSEGFRTRPQRRLDVVVRCRCVLVKVALASRRRPLSLAPHDDDEIDRLSDLGIQKVEAGGHS